MAYRLIVILKVDAPSRLRDLNDRVLAIANEYDQFEKPRFFMGVRNPPPGMCLTVGTFMALVSEDVASDITAEMKELPEFLGAKALPHPDPIPWAPPVYA